MDSILVVYTWTGGADGEAQRTVNPFSLWVREFESLPVHHFSEGVAQLVDAEVSKAFAERHGVSTTPTFTIFQSPGCPFMETPLQDWDVSPHLRKRRFPWTRHSWLE